MPPKKQQPPNNSVAIIRQLEFYFSIKSYRRDHYLQRLATQNPEYWIPISELVLFNKMKMMGATVDNTIEALKS